MRPRIVSLATMRLRVSNATFPKALVIGQCDQAPEQKDNSLLFTQGHVQLSARVCK